MNDNWREVLVSIRVKDRTDGSNSHESVVIQKVPGIQSNFALTGRILKAVHEEIEKSNDELISQPNAREF